MPCPEISATETFCQELVRKAVEGLGSLEIVVSNAARQQVRQSILDVTSEDFDATMKPASQARVCHHRYGVGAGVDRSPDLYDYAQTKAATMNYVKSLAKQLRAKGIRVNGRGAGADLDLAGLRWRVDGEARKVRPQTSFGRPGQPAELASIYVQLADADASFATGQIYGSAGGTGQP